MSIYRFPKFRKLLRDESKLFKMRATLVDKYSYNTRKYLPLNYTYVVVNKKKAMKIKQQTRKLNSKGGHGPNKNDQELRHHQHKLQKKKTKRIANKHQSQ